MAAPSHCPGRDRLAHTERRAAMDRADQRRSELSCRVGAQPRGSLGHCLVGRVQKVSITPRTVGSTVTGVGDEVQQGQMPLPKPGQMSDLLKARSCQQYRCYCLSGIALGCVAHRQRCKGSLGGDFSVRALKPGQNKVYRDEMH